MVDLGEGLNKEGLWFTGSLNRLESARLQIPASPVLPGAPQ